jgi:predicted MFS family arabinose efflux permease
VSWPPHHGRDRGIAFGVWGAVSSAAAALGPVAGGLLTQYASWRWIFLVNLPVSVAAVWLTLRALPESRAAGRARIDLAGLATFTVAAGTLTDALIRSSDNGWTQAATLGQLLVAAVALAGFVAVERRRAQPMLDLALFHRPAFVAIMLAATLLSAGAFAYLPYTSLWLQSVLGHGAVQAGLTILPLSIAALVVSAGIGRLLHGRSPRWPIGGGLGLIGAGALLQALVRADSSGRVLLPGLLVAGVGVGLAVPSLSSAALAAVPAERSGMASGAVNAFRQLGFALGIAVFGAVFQSRAEQVLRDRGHLPDPAAAARALGGGQAHSLLARAPAGQRATIDHLVHQAVAAGLSQVCLAAAAMGLLAGLLVLILLRSPSAQPPALHPTSDSPPATLTAGNATAARVHDGQPSAALIDSQAVRAADTALQSSRGFDAEKVNGRKRHIAVDTLGLLLATVVTAASVQDWTETAPGRCYGACTPRHPSPSQPPAAPDVAR